MKKSIVLAISVMSIGSFAVLVYYGLRHSRGVPVEIEKPEKITLEVPYRDSRIDLADGISPDIWEGIIAQEIDLMYQVMVLPWGKSLVSPIRVKSFHNNEDIYFSISWNDDTNDNTVGINRFIDACGIMFPIEKKIQPSTLMMGFMNRSNVWQWKASQNDEYWYHKEPETGAYVDFYYPFEKEEVLVVSKVIPESAVNDLLAIRVGTITRKETQRVQGRGFRENGTWHVVFKRSLKPSSLTDDIAFNPGEEKILCAFAVWNGATGDRGGRKSISNWVELEVKQ